MRTRQANRSALSLHLGSERGRRLRRRESIAVVLAVSTFAIVGAACGSDEKTSTTPPADDSSAAAATSESTSGSPASDDAASNATVVTVPPGESAFVLLDVDPCALLTVPEMEAAVESGLERGGFGEDLPGRCTYSIGGDVGAGVVGISLGDPLVCDAVRRAIDAGSSATGEIVDVGQGGVVDTNGGIIQFLVGGGCVGISGSDSGHPLDPTTLVSLAEAAAGRVG